MMNLTFEHDASMPPFGRNELKALEKQLGCELPADFQEFLLNHNGGTPDKGYFEAPHHPGTTWVDEFLAFDQHLATPTKRAAAGSVAFMHHAFGEFVPDDCLIVGVVARDNLLLLRVRGDHRGQVDLKVMDELGPPLASRECGKDKERGVHSVASSFAAFLEMLHDEDAYFRETLREDGRAPLAASATHLDEQVQGAVDEHEAYGHKVGPIDVDFAQEPIDPSPWRALNPENRVVYVQARRRERPRTQWNRWNKHYANEFEPRGIGLPTRGSIGGFSWTIQLPSGERFYAFSTHGDHECWMNAINAFASAEGRLIGTIEGNGERFVLDDGRTFPLSETSCEPLADHF
jgi:SMI1 / KNR4 family (SUKH-1)